MAEPLTVHKLAHLIPGNEGDGAQAFLITHVMSRTATPAVETDSAQALTVTTGAKHYKTLVPVSESG